MIQRIPTTRRANRPAIIFAIITVALLLGAAFAGAFK